MKIPNTTAVTKKLSFCQPRNQVSTLPSCSTLGLFPLDLSHITIFSFTLTEVAGENKYIKELTCILTSSLLVPFHTEAPVTSPRSFT